LLFGKRLGVINFQTFALQYSVFFGKTGTSLFDHNYSPYRNTDCRPFDVDSTTLDIVIWVANFNHFRGGIFKTLNFGLTENSIKQREKAIVTDLIVIISLLLMFVYHIVLYFANTRDNVALFFSLTCLFFAFDFSMQDTMTFFLFSPTPVLPLVRSCIPFYHLCYLLRLCSFYMLFSPMMFLENSETLPELSPLY